MAVDRRGGQQQPDGRPRPPAGPGRLANRQDMSQPVRSPNVGDTSSLQYGDRQRIEAGQKVQPLGKQQNPSGRAAVQQQAQQRVQAPSGIPGEPSNPLDFLARKLKGTLSPGAGGDVPTGQLQTQKWLPMLRALASDPGSGGVLQHAVMSALSRAMRNPNYPDPKVVDLNEADRIIETALQEQ